MRKIFYSRWTYLLLAIIATTIFISVHHWQDLQNKRSQYRDQYLKIMKENIHIGEPIKPVCKALARLGWGYDNQPSSQKPGDRVVLVHLPDGGDCSPSPPSSSCTLNIDLEFHEGILASISGWVEDSEV